MTASRPAAPSVSEYVEAFRNILPSLSDSHLALLRAHYQAPERSLTAAELAEAAVESEREAAATEVDDESELAEAVDEFGGESVLPETIGEDAAELGADTAEDVGADATIRQYGSIGQALFEQLPAFLKQCKRRHKDGMFDNIAALAEARDRSGPRETWVWRMRPQVAAALEELGLTARE
jgi:hypothetical protein